MKKNIIKVLDSLFTKCIQQRAHGRCEFCGKLGTDTAHVYSRANLWSRWYQDNAFWLCHDCHLASDRDRKTFRAKVQEIYGEERYEVLRELAQKAQPMYPEDYEEIKKELYRKKHK